MSILRFDDLKAVPWKNGLGVTREIAVEPVGASMDDFLWRVSIADVDTASPFSTFPGIDRTIVLLEGDGFTMTLDGEREHALTTPLAPFDFPGEARVDVTLSGGATRDFNLMVRRGVRHGRVDVIRGPVAATVAEGAVLLYVARGEARVDGQTCREGDSVIGPHHLELPHGATALIVMIGEI
ncbi:HutD family protein [Luteibacter sp. RCC_6_2]|uniref:HutD/Ves family protein n=1 Tax=Luteibacter sp. RCC_6_2 TaxID=3239223 RepID=UPI0035262A73